MNPLSRAPAAAILALATLAGVAASASPAAAHDLIPGVTGCDAPGGQQLGGAAIGGVLGGLLGSGISSHGQGTIPGAVIGAGLGSYIGCTNQRARAAEHAYTRAYYQPYRRTYAAPRREVAYYAPEPRKVIVRHVARSEARPVVNYRAWGQ